MANYSIIFNSSEESGLSTKSECFLNRFNQITILIENGINSNEFKSISLDKASAIKFAKVLRTEINKIEG